MRLLPLLLSLLFPGASPDPRVEVAVSQAVQAFPHSDLSTWRTARIDPDNVGRVLNQLAVHAWRYPQVARDLQSVECSESGFVGKQIGVTVNSGTRQLTLMRFRESWLKSDREKAARTASHEFAHAVDHWLRYDPNSGIDEFKRQTFKTKDARGTKASEAWAECFESFHHEKPRWHSKNTRAVMAYLERVLPQP